MGRKIVLGLGNTVDYEIQWDTAVFEAMIQEYDIRPDECFRGCEIQGVRDLLRSILGFMKEGGGGERHVADLSAIEAFARRFDLRITMGGTPVRAAAAMAALGQRPWLHLVTLNDHVRRLLPHGCRYISSSQEENLYPHLIIQYRKGTHIQTPGFDFITGRSNRIIFVNDKDNEQMRISPELPVLLSDAGIFLIGGFNAMHDADLLTRRLQELRLAMDRLPASACVFYEDACFHKASLSRIVHKHLLPRINIYSMNEDEMQDYFGQSIDLLDAAAVANALAAIKEAIPVPHIVVHTRHWALAYGKDAARLQNGLKGGISMATTRFQYGDDFSAAQYSSTASAPAEEKGLRFSLEISAQLGPYVCCLPSVQADDASPTTIGLGDAFVGGFLAAMRT